MTLEEARYNLIRITRRQRLVMIVDALLWAVAATGVAYIIISLIFSSEPANILFGTPFGIIAFVVRSRMLGVYSFDEQKMIRLINAERKEYEESTDLLFDQRDLTTLQLIQQSRTLVAFSKSYDQIHISNRLPIAIVASVIALISAWMTYYLMPAHETFITKKESAQAIAEPELPSAIRSVILTVTPPSYTGLTKFDSEKLNTVVPEGSTIGWTVLFSDKTTSAAIRIGSSDSVVLKSIDGNKFSTQRKPGESFIYQFAWTDQTKKQSTSPYYTIEITRDQAPSIKVEELNQFTQLTQKDEPAINLKANLADDFGLNNAHIIATVSKGSGESVKFREEKLFFASPEKISGKQLRATRKIDLKKLGMEPGDELYFYVEAFDNKIPAPNRTRTETFFISLQDTASQELSLDAGLGVDLMPEYFRSQRQIIIDTEKLLRDRKKLTAHQFKQTSNELGYDQKVLRLKYGEFLGEEFESGIGPQNPTTGEGAQSIEEAVKQYGHTHDTENEHNLVEDKKTPHKEEAKGEEHHHHEGEEGKEESPLEAFAHNHDNAEAATFFVLSVKAKLKAALTVMWDAELYLRVYEPEKSLPYQYQALKLLKEISQDSRVYVHRTGFDPPPIKEESRLKGDLNETKSTTDFYKKEITEQFPATAHALALVESMITRKETILSSSGRSTLQQAGNEISGIALQKPGEYLKTLSLIQDVLQDKVPQDKMIESLRTLRATFWTVIPPKTSTPDSKSLMLHELDRQFIENLPHD
jgi:hypothetical protein